MKARVLIVTEPTGFGEDVDLIWVGEVRWEVVGSLTFDVNRPLPSRDPFSVGDLSPDPHDVFVHVETRNRLVMNIRTDFWEYSDPNWLMVPQHRWEVDQMRARYTWQPFLLPLHWVKPLKGSGPNPNDRVDFVTLESRWKGHTPTYVATHRICTTRTPLGFQNPREVRSKSLLRLLDREHLNIENCVPVEVYHNFFDQAQKSPFSPFHGLEFQHKLPAYVRRLS